MTAPSYNSCHNGLSRPSNDNAWNSSYPDIPWASTACYPMPGMGVGQNLLHSSPDSSSNSSIPPLPTSPCHTSAAIPASSYQPNRVAWPVGSQSGYIIPDIHSPACQSNTTTNSSLTRIPSFSSSQEESPETMGVGNLCGHGAIAHSRQASSIDVNHYGRYKCRWEGCAYNGAFSRQTCLWRHIKSTHVAPEEFKCPVRDCKETFGRKDKLQTHLRHYHIGHGKPESCYCHS